MAILGNVSRGQAWTAEERKKLVALADVGLCAAEIAERMGRSPASIRGEARRQDPPLRLAPHVSRWTPEDKARLRDLAREATYAEAAVVMGRTPVAVRFQARELHLFWRNVQGQGRKYNPREDDQIQRAAERKEPPRMVASALSGRNSKSVRRRLERLRRRLGGDR